MKTYKITVSGKTESDILNGIQEAAKRIEQGTKMGFDSNDDGEFNYTSEGDYDANNIQPTTKKN